MCHRQKATCHFSAPHHHHLPHSLLLPVGSYYLTWFFLLFSTICKSSIVFSLLIPVPAVRPADVSPLYWLSMSRSGRYTRGMMITLKRAFGHSLTTLQSDVYLKKKEESSLTASCFILIGMWRQRLAVKWQVSNLMFFLLVFVVAKITILDMSRERRQI